LHKGVDLLVAAVKTLIGEGIAISLDIWGPEHEEPDYVQRLKRDAAQFRQIRWNGQFGGAGSWQALADVDAVVVPSRWLENSPNVILESFAMKRPVVATNFGGMSELVEEGINGLLFRLDDVTDLTRQLRRLAQEPALLARLSAGIAPVKTLDQEMQELLDLYQRVRLARHA
jgi:glycosyltransferase involved in cell wall biosynthesis